MALKFLEIIFGVKDGVIPLWQKEIDRLEELNRECHDSRGRANILRMRDYCEKAKELLGKKKNLGAYFLLYQGYQKLIDFANKKK